MRSTIRPMRLGSDFRNQICATGRGELDMAHALAPDLGERDLDAALLADDAAELHPLVLAAQALVVLDRAEDAGAEQPVPLRLEGAVVDGLGLLDLAIGPGPDLLRRGHLDLDLVEGHGLAGLTENLHQLVHAALTIRGGPWRRTEERHTAVHRPEGIVGTDQAACWSRSTFRPSDFSSLTRTLKLSGMPASKLSCSRTIAS